MSASVEIFWSERPAEGSENQFLSQIKSDLEACSISAVILANFYTQKDSRQLDFFVITDKHAALIELKNYHGILEGDTNGHWSEKQEDGSLTAIDRENPYAQVLSTKYALSHDMRTFAATRDDALEPAGGKFYMEFDTVVCIYPSLEDGSKLPSDYKVQTMGYAEFLQFIIKPGKRMRWPSRILDEFVRFYGLTSSRALPKDIAIADAEKVIVDYTRRFKDFYKQGLQGIIPIEIESSNTNISSLAIADMFQDSRTLQLVGASGAGKTHIAMHTAIRMLENDWVPFFIHASAYTDKTSSLLKRSAASFSVYSLEELFRLAFLAKKTIVIIIDGYNECPDRAREMLLQDLSALSLRLPVKILITTQINVELPETIKGQALVVPPPSKSEREKILALYEAPSGTEQYEAFTTPYELSLAAECANELSFPFTRMDLFDTYIRRKLTENASPSGVRAILRRLALEMSERVTTSIPVSDAWRMGEELLHRFSLSITTIDEAMGSSLVKIYQGKLMFSHELIGRFLAAESLALTHLKAEDLVQAIKRPKHKDLKEFVVSLRREDLHDIFENLADSGVVTAALQGEMGDYAKGLAEHDVQEAFRDVTQRIKSARVAVKSFYECSFSDGLELTDYQLSLLYAAGQLVNEGMFFEEVVELLKVTDEMCAQRNDGPKKGPSTTVSTVYVGFSANKRNSPAAQLLEAYEHGRWSASMGAKDGPTQSPERLLPVLSAATPQSYGILLFLGNILQYSHSKILAKCLPMLLDTSLKSQAYHVILQAYQTAQFMHEYVKGKDRDRVIALLESYTQSNIMLSTALVDTLNAYGLIDPIVSAAQVREEIQTVLAAKRGKPTYELANSIVAKQFEEIFSDTYYEAIESLSKDDKIKLLVMACSGSLHGWGIEWILHSLLKLNDKRALPAFRRWATEIEDDTPMPQDTTAAFCMAVVGYSRFSKMPPPRLIRKNSSRSISSRDNELDCTAWRMYGEIMFWMTHPNTSKEDMHMRCLPVWEAITNGVTTAVDPLYQFSIAMMLLEQSEEQNPYGLLITNFPDKIRIILEKYMRDDLRATSIFRHTQEKDIKIYAIKTLGSIGGRESTEILMGYCDDEALGVVSVDAIHRIRGRI